MDTSTTLILFGFIGAFLAEFVSIWRCRQKPINAWPDYYKTIPYWIIMFVMCLIGAGLVYAYIGDGNHITRILALNIGASAPVIIARLSGKAPKIA